MGLSAVDGNDRGIDETSIAGEQESDELADFLGLAEALHRVGLNEFLSDFFPVLGIDLLQGTLDHGGHDGARRDDVDLDAVLAVFDS